MHSVINYYFIGNSLDALLNGILRLWETIEVGGEATGF